MRAGDKHKKIAVLDAETDPFEYEFIPRPFAFEFYDGEIKEQFWGDDCIERFVEFLETLEDEYIIYAHNGGKFDFFFFVKDGYIENPIQIINGRIVKAELKQHQIRDSYSIIPVALAKYQKTKIDYNLFKRDARELHKQKILDYLHDDCRYLYELVTAFINRFGLKLTIGSTAITQLKRFHGFEKQTEDNDNYFRPAYFGGRTQHFESGVQRGKWKVYDVNSMYPFVMAEYRHCSGRQWHTTDGEALNALGQLKHDLTKPYFITVKGWNRSAFPIRTDEGLDFTCEYGTFYVTSHEYQIALKYDLFTPEYIERVDVPYETMNFRAFVDYFIKEKIEAKQDGDKVRELFAKFMLNSAYGKFGQNPANFYDWHIRLADDALPNIAEWEIYLDYNAWGEIWRRPIPPEKYHFNDVTVAASITGAARSVLLEALAHAKRPVYCDTDSIICESLDGLPLDPYELGAWDLEGEGDTIAIAGKKLYALFNNGQKVKQANKGVKLTAMEILQIAQGDVIEYANPVPVFGWDGSAKFIKRAIRKTGNIDKIRAFG